MDGIACEKAISDRSQVVCEVNRCQAGCADHMHHHAALCEVVWWMAALAQTSSVVRSRQRPTDYFGALAL